MRSSSVLASSLCVLSSVVAAFQIPSSNYASFLSPQTDGDDDILAAGNNGTSLASEGDELRKRQQARCPSNYNSCASFAAIYSAACCPRDSVCTTDFNRNAACCSTGATCTGTIASATVIATASATVTATYVTNEFFPFPYIPTVFANSAACTSAYSACQTNYALCTQGLNGGGFGVTISAFGGGGVTVAPSATNLGFSSATSVCNSLSSEACQGLETSACAQYGTGAGTATTTNSVFIVGTNAAPKPTLGAMAAAAAGVVAGVGFGFAG
ncbi:hypothetical protein PVAG01_07159 [Phlyctema vagabunda]|uniref:Uncharacterized protein n=1 Tax=Phlyctema vagabunda TaxID=108571 RepID=A0ABR4PBM3_9HELO